MTISSNGASVFSISASIALERRLAAAVRHHHDGDERRRGLGQGRASSTSAQVGREPSQRLRVAERAGALQRLELLLVTSITPFRHSISSRSVLDLTLDLVGERQPLEHELARLGLVGPSQSIELRLEFARVRSRSAWSSSSSVVVGLDTEGWYGTAGRSETTRSARRRRSSGSAARPSSSQAFATARPRISGFPITAPHRPGASVVARSSVTGRGGGEAGPRTVPARSRP